MSPPRFYCPQLASSPKSTEARYFLDAAEARHATSVLRLRVDDRVTLFDGHGGAVSAKVIEARRDTVGVEVVEWSAAPAGLSAEFTLAIALPKGDRQKTLIDAATELGVRRLVPILCERGVAQPTDNALDRLRRQVIEACKQCGRNQLMEICQPLAIADLANAFDQSNPLRLVAHPYDLTGRRLPLRELLPGAARHCVLAIGPEGGFTDAEVCGLVEAGWSTCDLGPLILRIEIAALSAAAQVMGWSYAVSEK